MQILYRKKKNLQKQLTKSVINTIVETSFDCFVTPQKTAIITHSTSILIFILIKKSFYSELKLSIQTKIIEKSKGFKACGKQILKLI